MDYKKMIISCTFGDIEIVEIENQYGRFDIKISIYDDVVYKDENTNYIKLDDLIKLAKNILYAKCYGK